MNKQSLIYAIIGTTVSSILFTILGGPLLGGGIAGYLEGSDVSDGLKIGGLVGVGTLLVAGSAYLLRTWLTFETGVPPLVGVLGDSIIFVLLFGAIYSIGLSMVGGLGGSYVANRQDSNA